MTTNEFVEYLLQTKKENQEHSAQDESAAYEAAQLISGSFVFSLYGTLWQYGFDMETATEHLEAMYDKGDHFGLVYFIFMLADAVDYVLPLTFSDMGSVDLLVPVLSAAIIEDWLEYNATSEVEIIEYE